MGSSGNALWRSQVDSTRTYFKPSRRARSRRITRNPSAPAQGMTQSNSRMGSAISRAFRYSSNVSFFLNMAWRYPSALSRCATHSLPKSWRVAPNSRM